LIQDGVNGFLVPASDWRALADKMELLLGNPGLRAELGSNGRRAVMKSYDMEANGGAMHDLFARYIPVPDTRKAGAAP
jgi:glycosyltransferase involved in cell wall biosynthesis